MMFRRVVFVFACCLTCVAAQTGATDRESGSFFLREYSPKTYHAAPQNWAIAQDKRGVIYVGNNDGILEFDGENWRKLALPNASTVRSLAVDDQGTVYVGGQAEIGYLKPDKAGALTYISLLDQVNPKDRIFGDVWATLATRNGVVFSSNQRLFRWSPGRAMQVRKPRSRFSSAFAASGDVYLMEAGEGLFRLGANALERTPGGESFSGSEPLRGVFQWNGRLVVATTDGLFAEEHGRFQPLRTQAAELLRASRIYRCLPLSNGDVAVGTVHRGVVLLNAQGQVRRVIDSAAGLRGNSVTAMYLDRQGGLWLGLNNGLARLEVAGPATRFTEREGLEEIVLAIERYDGTIYAGTMAGLTRLSGGANGTTPHFEPVPGINGQVATLLPTENGLLAGAPGGLFQVTRGGVRKLDVPGGVLELTASRRDPSLVYAAGRNGLFALQASGSVWREAHHIDAGKYGFLSAAEDAEGRVWATTLGDVWRVDFRKTPAEVQRFAAAQGVPAGWKYAYRIAGSDVFATEHGLFRFDAAAARWVADTQFGQTFGDGSRPVTAMFETPDRQIWITGGGYHGVLRRTPSGAYAWDQNVLGNFGIQELYGLHVDPDGTVWAAGMESGMVRFDPLLKRKAEPAIATLVRQVAAGRDRTVFAGGAAELKNAPRLPYIDNALHFDYAAPFFEGVSDVEYRVRLDGLDRDWSPWTTNAAKEYTNLWEGRYLFRAQARDSKGRTGHEATFAFSVLPPWYRTWWAYVLYGIAALVLMWLIMKWRLVASEARNRKLECIIEERTEQIRQREKETEGLLLNILPASVARELRDTGAVQPLICDDITVCFTDFVSFTLSTESMPGGELVAALNRYFTEFDRIIDRYGLEKVKTIGDSYMFVSGLPEPRPSHAVDAVLAALEIVEAVERLSTQAPGWKIRVGLHSGPVVAGVVGVRKFAFDIWGRTVNFASRHESSGKPNAVNVSEQTYRLICDFFHCDPRGPILIKEGRQLEMFLVRGVHPDLCGLTIPAERYLFEDLYRERFNMPPPEVPGLDRMASGSIKA